MDTSEVASRLNVSARTLRQFLRSPHSTFVAVGSGSRYEFTDQDFPTLQRRFTEWQAAGKPRPQGKRKKSKNESPDPVPNKQFPEFSDRDVQVWDDEESTYHGVPELEDIRKPQVRRRVLADARAAEDRLMMLLLSRGMHVTQLGNRVA